jgi:hypothetical protein
LYITLPVSLFVYMIWSRGPRGLLVLLGHLAAAVALYALARLAAGLLGGTGLPL